MNYVGTNLSLEQVFPLEAIRNTSIVNQLRFEDQGIQRCPNLVDTSNVGLNLLESDFRFSYNRTYTVKTNKIYITK